MNKKNYCLQIPASSLDLTNELGYGVIFQPVLSQFKSFINPFIIRPVRGAFRRVYTRKDKPRKR